MYLITTLLGRQLPVSNCWPLGLMSKDAPHRCGLGAINENNDLAALYKTKGKSKVTIKES